MRIQKLFRNDRNVFFFVCTSLSFDEKATPGCPSLPGPVVNILFLHSSSWDEHVFELVLPKACMVGHVDFKFVLNANITNIPHIQVTLLKNKAPGLGKVNGKHMSVVQTPMPFCPCFETQTRSPSHRDGRGPTDFLSLIPRCACQWGKEWSATASGLLL